MVILESEKLILLDIVEVGVISEVSIYSHLDERHQSNGCDRIFNIEYLVLKSTH